MKRVPFSWFHDLKSNPLWDIFVGPHYRHAWLFGLILIPNGLAALLEGTSFGMILLSFSVLNGEPVHTYPFLSALQGMSSHALFALFGFLAILCQAIRSGVSYLGQWATIHLSLKIQTAAQLNVYRQILRLSFPCVSRYKAGELAEYAKTPSVFIGGCMDAINRLVIAVLMIVVSIGILFWMSISLTLLALCLFGLFSVSQKVILKALARSSKHLCQHLEDFSKQTVQNLYGMRAIHTYHRQADVFAQILGTLTKISHCSKKLGLGNHAIILINEIVAVVLAGTILAAGMVLLPLSGAALLPVLMTFMTVTYRLATRVQMAIGALGGIASSMGYILKLRDILEGTGKEYTPSGGIPFQRFTHSIEFRHVSLRYANQTSDAIHDFSCTIPKGSVIALVGASGAGKSSIVDLLSRLYSPSSGEIFVDGTPLAQYEVGSWRQRLGVVSQDTFIFNETIEENIRFGAETASRSQVIEAAKSAGAHAFIEALPEQYCTVVGERGYRLSGGERQRLALARALLREPDLLILDEATSNLDSHSEFLIQTALETFHKGRTTLIVAHRLSTIAKADRILVMHAGTLIEYGSHEELLMKGTAYAAFWQRQFSAVTLA